MYNCGSNAESCASQIRRNSPNFDFNYYNCSLGSYSVKQGLNRFYFSTIITKYSLIAFETSTPGLIALIDDESTFLDYQIINNNEVFEECDLKDMEIQQSREKLQSSIKENEILKNKVLEFEEQLKVNDSIVEKITNEFKTKIKSLEEQKNLAEIRLANSETTIKSLEIETDATNQIIIENRKTISDLQQKIENESLKKINDSRSKLNDQLCLLTTEINLKVMQIAELIDEKEKIELENISLKKALEKEQFESGRIEVSNQKLECLKTEYKEKYQKLLIEKEVNKRPEKLMPDEVRNIDFEVQNQNNERLQNELEKIRSSFSSLEVKYNGIKSQIECLKKSSELTKQVEYANLEIGFLKMQLEKNALKLTQIFQENETFKNKNRFLEELKNRQDNLIQLLQDEINNLNPEIIEFERISKNNEIKNLSELNKNLTIELYDLKKKNVTKDSNTFTYLNSAKNYEIFSKKGPTTNDKSFVKFSEESSPVNFATSSFIFKENNFVNGPGNELFSTEPKPNGQEYFTSKLKDSEINFRSDYREKYRNLSNRLVKLRQKLQDSKKEKELNEPVIGSLKTNGTLNGFQCYLGQNDGIYYYNTSGNKTWLNHEKKLKDLFHGGVNSVLDSHLRMEYNLDLKRLVEITVRLVQQKQVDLDKLRLVRTSIFGSVEKNDIGRQIAYNYFGSIQFKDVVNIYSWWHKDSYNFATLVKLELNKLEKIEIMEFDKESSFSFGSDFVSRINVELSDEDLKTIESFISHYNQRSQFNTGFDDFLSQKLQEKGVKCWLRCSSNRFKNAESQNKSAPFWTGKFKCIDNDCTNIFKSSIRDNLIRHYSIVYDKYEQPHSIEVKILQNYVHMEKIEPRIRSADNQRKRQAVDVLAHGISECSMNNLLFNTENTSILGKFILF
ncbi:unnamed protein product [Brachionus calyciflorus]|uniref:Uncharacterized protein n=1 Tax=Brachionus calyciflorus TaxID=104777 RepID=A0A814CYS0_9BILA|nr:unnamed protein product [Brachionus calyciflorus]